MSELKPGIDLDVFARAPTTPRPRRRWWPRLLPIALLLAFGAILWSTLHDLGRSAVRVAVVRPQAASASDGSALAAGGELQRSGWVEPDPFAIQVTPLVAGVVRELLVLEGDPVAVGQPVAQLDEGAAQAAVAIARAARDRAQAEAAGAAADAQAAQASFDAALAVTEALALAEAELAGRTAEQQRRAAAAAQGGAAVQLATEELELARWLAEQGSAGPREVERATARVAAEQSALAMLEAEAALAAAQVAKATAALARARQERELRVEEKGRLAAAQAAAAAAKAAHHEAEARLAAAELELERHVVRAPTAGVVLQRLVAAGSATGGPDHGALVTLYDPTQLRVRIDVEQTEVAKLAVGGAASVRAPTRPAQPYRGTITRIVRQANVEKVTLQVHVRIDEPDAALRPEMLVETRFALAAGGATSAGGGAGTAGASVTIPMRLLLEEAGAASVWLVDGATGRAAKRRVTVAGTSGDRASGRATLSAGVNLSDKLIEPLDPGGAPLVEGAALELVERATEGR